MCSLGGFRRDKWRKGLLWTCASALGKQPRWQCVTNPGNRWLMFWKLNMASKIRLSVSQAWIPAIRAAIRRQTSAPSAWMAFSFRLRHTPHPHPPGAIKPVPSHVHLIGALGPWLLAEAVCFLGHCTFPLVANPLSALSTFILLPSPLPPCPWWFLFSITNQM